MNNDSSLRSSRAVLIAGIVICSLLVVVNAMGLIPRRNMPAALPSMAVQDSDGQPVLKSLRSGTTDVERKNRQIAAGYAEFYPLQSATTGRTTAAPSTAGQAAAGPTTARPNDSQRHESQTGVSQSGASEFSGSQSRTSRPFKSAEAIRVASSQRELVETSPLKSSDETGRGRVGDETSRDNAASTRKTQAADVFQKEHFVDARESDADRRASSSAQRASSPATSSRLLSTTTVVEKRYAPQQSRSLSSFERNSGSSTESVVVSEFSDDESHQAAPHMLMPHITVPVTVNVDNGEILTELMRIQEQVRISHAETRSHHAQKLLQRSEQRSETSPSETEFVSAIGVAVPGDSHVVIPMEAATATERSTGAVVRNPETPAPVRMAELPQDEPVDFDFVEHLGEPSRRDQVVASGETTGSFEMESTPALEDDYDPFADFEAPRQGIADDVSEESLPVFELPPQALRSTSSLSSYAEWLRSLDQNLDQNIDENLDQDVVFLGYKSNEQIDLYGKPAKAELSIERVSYSVIEEELPSPGFPPVNSEVAASGPSTPVPPVPSYDMSEFVEPGTFSALPRRDEPTLEIPAQTKTEISKAVSHSVPASGTQITPPASKRVIQASATVPARESRTLPPRVTVEEPRRAPKPGAGSNSPGMMARMKHRMARVTGKIPKPDLDTPMWVDRLADWKDDRFGKKSEVAPRNLQPDVRNSIATVRPGPAAQKPPAVAPAQPGERPPLQRYAGRPSRTTTPATAPGPDQRTIVASTPLKKKTSPSQTPAQVSTPILAQTRTGSEVQQATYKAPPESFSFEPRQSASQPVTAQSPAKQTAPESQIQMTAAESYSTQGHTAQSRSGSSVPQRQPQASSVTRAAHVSSATFAPQPLPQRAPQTVKQPVPQQYVQPQYVQQQYIPKPEMTQVDVEPGVLVECGNCPPVGHSAEETVYVGAMEAFNYRMTMVVRPPNISNVSLSSVPRWFSGLADADPFASVRNSPTLRRVGAGLRYASQPKTVR